MLLSKFVLRAAVAACVIGVGVQSAFADFDVRPYNVGGQIHTGGFDDGTTVFIATKSAFGYSFGGDPTDPFFTQDPGFNAEAGSGLTGGSTMAFDILGPTSGSILPFNLSYWNGVGAVSWGSVPSGEVLNYALGSHAVNVGSGTAMIAGYNLQVLTSLGAMHQHLGASLLGSDGNSIPAGPGAWGAGDGIEAAPGIYALALQLRNGSQANSSPFYIVYDNGIGDTALAAAIASVPEPSSLVLSVIGVAAGSLIVRKRKRGTPIGGRIATR
jgi:hypothetical protein